MFMPANPAAPDSTAPTTKPTVETRPNVSARMIATTTPTIAIAVYWRVRYAFAPSWMAAAMSCIRSSPAGCASSHRLVAMQYSTAITPQIIAI